uniref:Bifunctional inhibitor/plant lipid transfer protein/seed storage helical domain-containing protein n=1 Tax=Oryza nivara TaxID=4536 RepID=A0A0E0GQS5_ORYNI
MEILTVMVILLAAASTGSSARMAGAGARAEEAACEPPCGGLVVGAGGAPGKGAPGHSIAAGAKDHLAAVEHQPSPSVTNGVFEPTEGEAPDQDHPCDADSLANDMLSFCINQSFPPPNCCQAVTVTVDLSSCLCMVASRSSLRNSSLSAFTILALYANCGGLRAVRERDAAACYGAGDAPEDPGRVPVTIPASPTTIITRERPPAMEMSVEEHFPSFDRFMLCVIETMTGFGVLIAVVVGFMKIHWSVQRQRKDAANRVVLPGLPPLPALPAPPAPLALLPAPPVLPPPPAVPNLLNGHDDV